MISEMREQDKSNTTSLIYIDQFMDQYQFPSQSLVNIKSSTAYSTVNLWWNNCPLPLNIVMSLSPQRRPYLLVYCW